MSAEIVNFGLAKNERLNALLAEAMDQWDRMSETERNAMLKAQKESYVRGEMSWPRPKYHWVNGVKVYETYADYCND